MSKIRKPTPEEHVILDELNEQVKPFGFDVFYYNKGGLKNSERPWRIGRKRADYLRFFHTLDLLQKFVDRLVFEYVQVEKMNTMFKVYGSDARFKITLSGNKPNYQFTPHKEPVATPIPGGRSMRWTASDFKTKRHNFKSLNNTLHEWSAVEARYHSEIARAQSAIAKKQEAEA